MCVIHLHFTAFITKYFFFIKKYPGLTFFLLWVKEWEVGECDCTKLNFSASEKVNTFIFFHF